MSDSDPDIDPDAFANQLREWITASGVSQYQLSIDTGVPQSGISVFMHGGGLNLRTFTKLADAMDLELALKEEVVRNVRLARK